MKGCKFCTFYDGHLKKGFDLALELSDEWGVPEDFITFNYCPKCGRSV